MKKIAIFGKGGFGREVKTVIDHINKNGGEWEFIGFFDDTTPKNSESPYLGNLESLNKFDEPLALVLAVGNPEVREQIFKAITNTDITFPSLIHPTAVIGDPKTITIAQGSILTANVILTTNVTLGAFVILNLGVTVGHDSSLGDFASLMPGVNIAGDVHLKEKVYIGLGANVINEINIGKSTIIGGGSLVNKDLESHCTAVGIPAKVIKRRA